MRLPDIIPIFPLPNVVFFPRMPLPLHIFEPRYRAMVRDAVKGARLIGMTLLRGDWQKDYGGRPEIFGVGTVGELARTEELPDGRFDIVLRGLREFVIHRELTRAPYREAVVSWREPPRDVLDGRMRAGIGDLVLRYLRRTGRADAETRIVETGVDDETFVNFLAQNLDLEQVEKQALLEAANLDERARRLIDVLEFRLEELRLDPGGQQARRHH
jgi:Lon protease-like protein